MGWLLGLTAILLASCGPDNECDDPIRIDEQLVGESEVIFHSADSNLEIAQSFTPSETFNLTGIWVFIRKEGNLEGQLKFSIHRDDGGEPDDSILSGGGPRSIEAQNIGDVSQGLFIEFPDEPGLDAGKDYHLVISSDEDVDAENYFVLEGNSTDDVYSGGELLRFDETDDGEWVPTASNEDLRFIIEGCEVD